MYKMGKTQVYYFFPIFLHDSISMFVQTTRQLYKFFKEINEIDPILHRTKQSKVNHENGENISEQSYCIQLNEVYIGFSKVNVFKKKKKKTVIVDYLKLNIQLIYKKTNKNIKFKCSQYSFMNSFLSEVIQRFLVS